MSLFHVLGMIARVYGRYLSHWWILRIGIGDGQGVEVGAEDETATSKQNMHASREGRGIDALFLASTEDGCFDVLEGDRETSIAKPVKRSHKFIQHLGSGGFKAPLDKFERNACVKANTATM